MLPSDVLFLHDAFNPKLKVAVRWGDVVSMAPAARADIPDGSTVISMTSGTDIHSIETVETIERACNELIDKRSA